MPSGGIENEDLNSLIINKGFPIFPFYLHMKKVYAVSLGVAFASVISSNFSSQNLTQTQAATTEKGTLSLVANGEDFVRQGFVSKDGWAISFDRVAVNLADITAYQTESAFEPEKGATADSIPYREKIVLLDAAKTIDLAAGEADAEPILVVETETPAGFYNALSWKIAPNGDDSSASNKTIILQGQAVKDGKEIDFDISFNQPLEYICGEFVGDERKGIVTTEAEGEVETTFHFDHIFGDSEAPAEEALNQDALGFQPLADLASGNSLEVDQDTLAEQLSPENYQKLTNAIAGLGHVGEGHCALVSN